jgi:acylphosphatase
MTQAHVFYTGTVQGVGFRYSAQRMARELGLAGWVKNLPDGRVEMRIEGQEEKIKELIKNVDEHFDGYIKDKTLNYGSVEGNFKDFTVIF